MSAIKIIHQSLLSILIFSLWAGFALLIVNPIMNADLPQYVIGRICIWDYSAMALAILCSFLFTKYWGYPEVRMMDGKKKLILGMNYSYLFLGYFLFALVVAIWQFWIFSQGFVY